MNHESGPAFRDAAESAACSYSHHPIEDIEPLTHREEWSAEWFAGLLRWLASPGWRDRGCQALSIRVTAAVFTRNPRLLADKTGRRPRAADVAALLAVEPAAFHREVRSFRICQISHCEKFGIPPTSAGKSEPSAPSAEQPGRSRCERLSAKVRQQ